MLAEDQRNGPFVPFDGSFYSSYSPRTSMPGDVLQKCAITTDAAEMSANWTRHQVALRAALWPLDQSVSL